jgi:hypothetical protein
MHDTPRSTPPFSGAVPDPHGASLFAAMWDGKTGTVSETSRKVLPLAPRR